MKEIIRKLTECYGPSGHEAGVRQLILAELTEGGILSGRKIETRVDAMGNLLVHQKGNGGGRRVMLAAHMDEIGVVVTHVDQRGFLRFGSVGGVRPLSLTGGRVRFSDGTVGVIGLEKLEDAAKVPPLEKYFIDVGAASREDCLIKVGDIGCFQRPCEELGDRMIAKAMDDRIGCAVLIQALRELRASPHDLSFVFTVQEEIGLRGARVAAQYFNPALAIAIDATPAYDLPVHDGSENTFYNTRLGDGPAIYTVDSSTLNDPRLIRFLKETAERTGIPYQLRQPGGGGTDAGAIHRALAGIPSVSVSVPHRYTHSPASLSRIDDWKNTLLLLHAALARLTPGVLAREKA